MARWQSGPTIRIRYDTVYGNTVYGTIRLTLRIQHQRRSEAAAVLQALHNNLLHQDEEESEIFPMASQKEVDQCITRMLLGMGGERIGDAVTESEGEEDAKQSAADRLCSSSINARW